jgi:hypothetical protein
METSYQTQNIAQRNSHIMSNSSNTLRTLILQRIIHLKPTVDISEYHDYSDRDLLDDFEEILTEYIVKEQGLSAE